VHYSAPGAQQEELRGALRHARVAGSSTTAAAGGGVRRTPSIADLRAPFAAKFCPGTPRSARTFGGRPKPLLVVQHYIHHTLSWRRGSWRHQRGGMRA